MFCIIVKMWAEMLALVLTALALNSSLSHFECRGLIAIEMSSAQVALQKFHCDSFIWGLSMLCLAGIRHHFHLASLTHDLRQGLGQATERKQNETSLRCAFPAGCCALTGKQARNTQWPSAKNTTQYNQMLYR